MAQLAAARHGITLAEKLEPLVQEDVHRTGIADLIGDHERAKETDDE